MAELLSSRVLYKSPLVWVTDHRCRSGRCGRSGEECTTWHSIVLPRRGVFVKHVDGRTVTADANTVMFFRAGEPYRVSHPGDCGDDCTSFVPSPAVLSEALRPVDPAGAENPERPFAFTHGPSSAPGFLTHWGLVRDLARGGDDFEIDELVFDLIDEILQGAYRANGARPVRRRRSAATARAHRDTAEAVKARLSAGAAGRVDLSALARSVHSSPYHLSRLFKAQSGETISSYLRRLRTRRAMALLADGEGDLSRVAVLAGFFDHSHLTNAFRREFGVTPRRFSAGERQMSNGVQV